jgi:hypothetical protein
MLHTKNSDPNKNHLYMQTADVLEKTYFYIKKYDTADVLFEGNFNGTVSRDFVYPSGKILKVTGNVQLYK